MARSLTPGFGALAINHAPELVRVFLTTCRLQGLEVHCMGAVQSSPLELYARWEVFMAAQTISIDTNRRVEIRRWAPQPIGQPVEQRRDFRLDKESWPLLMQAISAPERTS